MAKTFLQAAADQLVVFHKLFYLCKEETETIAKPLYLEPVDPTQSKKYGYQPGP